MSDVVTGAVKALNERVAGRFSGIAKFVIEGEGAIMLDSEGARPGDEEADVTLTASRETFEGLLSGAVNPAAAFMTGKLAVAGDMGLALKLGSALA